MPTAKNSRTVRAFGLDEELLCSDVCRHTYCSNKAKAGINLNKEMRYIFINKIDDWFEAKVKEADLSRLFTSIVTEDTVVMTEEIGKLLRPTISYHNYSATRRSEDTAWRSLRRIVWW